jgi:hypothetical protein
VAAAAGYGASVAGRRGRLRARLATPGLLGLPVGWLAVFFVAPVCIALQLANPRAVTEPNAHLDRDIPRRALYAKMWQEVKAA